MTGDVNMVKIHILEMMQQGDPKVSFKTRNGSIIDSAKQFPKGRDYFKPHSSQKNQETDF
jgi:hypothetical protein